MSYPLIPLSDRPPPAQRPRTADDGPVERGVRLVDLDQEIMQSLIEYVANYREDFEKAPPLPEERLGVSYPRDHPSYGTFKDDFRPDPRRLSMCGVNRDTGHYCRVYLVTAFLGEEKKYWERQDHNILDVLQAIWKRDGVNTVERPVAVADSRMLYRRMAFVDVASGAPLEPADAIGVLLRARHWYPEYVRCREQRNGRKAFEDTDALRDAVAIVKCAQAIVRLADVDSRLAEFAAGALPMHPMLVNPVAPQGHDWLPDDQGKYDMPTDAKGWRAQARAIIAEYGAPDAWNTSRVTSFELVLAADVIGIPTTIDHLLDMTQWRGKPYDELERNGWPSFNGMGIALVAWLGAALRFQWPVGLYDTSNATSLELCFAECHSFNGYIHAWDTSKVTTMTKCFRNCEAFNKPLEHWNVRACRDFSYAFFNCSVFNQRLDTWAMQGATDLRYMFCGCKAFADPLDSWFDKLPRDPAPQASSMFYVATTWLVRAMVQKRDPTNPKKFFSRLAPYVNTEGDLSAGDGTAESGTLRLPTV